MFWFYMALALMFLSLSILCLCAAYQSRREDVLFKQVTSTTVARR